MRILQQITGVVLLVFVGTPGLAASYKEGEVSGGGTIQGSVLYSGPVKKRTVLPT